MKKTSASKKLPAQNFRRVIQLDASQMAIYKTGTIEILNPDGEQIDCIGKTTKQLNDNQIIEDTADNLRLIEDLLLCSSGEVQLCLVNFQYPTRCRCWITSGATGCDDCVHSIITDSHRRVACCTLCDMGVGCVYWFGASGSVAAFSTSSVPRELINANLKRNVTWCLAYDAGVAGESANLKYLKEINDLKEATRICLPHSADSDWDDLYREGKLTDEYLEDCKWRGRILAGNTVKKKAFALYCWKPYTHTVMNAFKQTYGIEVSTDGITKMLAEETMDFYKHADIFDLNVEVNQILNCELSYHHAEVDKFIRR